MKPLRSNPIFVDHGSAPGTIRAGVELPVEAWEEITSGWRVEGADEAMPEEPGLSLADRIALLLDCALAGWEQADDRSGIDPMDDPDDPWPF